MASERHPSCSGASELATLIVPDERAVTYNTYLKIHELLSLQKPLSSPPHHDETLFIVIHQVYELWFKQILHELDRAALALDEDQLIVFQRIAKRIGTIQSVLTHQVDILETMTPVDFSGFRDRLNPASGFQSHQFRLLEFKLGLREAGYLKFHAQDPQAFSLLEAELSQPSLYDRLLRVMHRRGYAIPDAILTRDVRQAYTPSEAVREAMVAVYRDSNRCYDLYSTLESLVDLDAGILLWRYRHVAMVERMIGTRMGTGGSSGAKYLASTLTKRFFPELWTARDALGSSGY